MKSIAAITVFAVAAMVFACSGGAESRKLAGESDSLCGVLGARLQDLRECDTAAASKALSAFQTCTAFISNSVRDTLDTATAASLRNYFEAGQQLQGALLRRQQLVTTAQLACIQLGKLSHDAVAGSIPYSQLSAYVGKEHLAAQRIADSAHALTTLFPRLLAGFLKSGEAVDAFIRVRNNGELPQTVQLH